MPLTPATSPIPSYFVVMCDYPLQRAREAVVNPEHTRSRIVDLIRRGEWEHVLFVHEIVPGEVVRDVTDEVMAEAGLAEESDGAKLDRNDAGQRADDLHRAARLRRLAGVA